MQSGSSIPIEFIKREIKIWKTVSDKSVHAVCLEHLLEAWDLYNELSEHRNSPNEKV